MVSPSIERPGWCDPRRALIPDSIIVSNGLVLIDAAALSKATLYSTIIWIASEISSLKESELLKYRLAVKNIDLLYVIKGEGDGVPLFQMCCSFIRDFKDYVNNDGMVIAVADVSDFLFAEANYANIPSKEVFSISWERALEGCEDRLSAKIPDRVAEDLLRRHQTNKYVFGKEAARMLREIDKDPRVVDINKKMEARRKELEQRFVQPGREPR